MSYKKIYKTILVILSLTIPTSLLLSFIINMKSVENSKQINHFLTKQSIQRWGTDRVDQTIITTIVDTEKDTNYPYQNKYTNKRAAGNDFNLPDLYWHTSQEPLLVSYIDVWYEFGFKTVEEFFENYSLKLDYIFNYNFWYKFLANKKWVLHPDNPKNVSLDKWEEGSYLFDKNTLRDQKIESGKHLFLEGAKKFSVKRVFKHAFWAPPINKTFYYMGAGVHIWYEPLKENTSIGIFAETGAFLDWHDYMNMKQASYMNFKAIEINIIKNSMNS